MSSVLQDRIAFVTGASRGIGAAVARRLHAAGAQVALASRSGDDLGLEGALGVTKFGQVGFIRSLDHELRERGVRCTNICPGGVATEFAFGDGREAGMPELDGMMSAEDVADVVLFALERPRSVRLLTASFRPAGEGSWG